MSDNACGCIAGMTLDYVVVNLQDSFAEGQVYVALSRARSMAGLQVVGNCSARDVKYVLSALTLNFPPRVHTAPEILILNNFSCEPLSNCDCGWLANE